MRLVAWNCREGFHRKYPHLLGLDFDVAVVTECGPFEPGLSDVREVSSVLVPAVDRPGHTKHIGVLGRDPWRVEPLPFVTDQPWLLPVEVTGPVTFTLLAVWALGREWVDRGPSYAQQTARVVAEVLPRLQGAVVLAGDLNAPINSSPTDARRHAETVVRLETQGIVSAFTAARGDVDPLAEPTLYHQGNTGQRFHIDHVFVPREWTQGLKVELGTYEEWVANRRSDHVPIIVDLFPEGPQL
jgi:hypothetical protein